MQVLDQKAFVTVIQKEISLFIGYKFFPQSSNQLLDYIDQWLTSIFFFLKLVCHAVLRLQLG